MMMILINSRMRKLDNGRDKTVMEIFVEACRRSLDNERNETVMKIRVSFKFETDENIS